MLFNFKNKSTLAGLALGGATGFLWYYFVGCASGSCPITSDPWISTGYGAMMGGLAFSSLTKNDELKQP